MFRNSALLQCAFFLLSSPLTTTAQVSETWLRANEQRVLQEFQQLLSIPNVASDTANIGRNATKLVEMMQARGIRTRLFQTPGAPPVVFGELDGTSSARTLAFYAHYDGQPVDRADWQTDPFDPVRKGDRIYARSASDDKATIIAMLAALDAMKAAGQRPASNLKFLFEGEEEAGSPHLATILREHAAELRADLWLICDGPVHQSGRQQVYFGARGTTGMEVTVYGPSRELHSGHYGGWAPNPALMLAHLLASMRDENGRVTIAGFYDGVTPLTALEKKALAGTPTVDADLRQELALGRQENPGRKLEDIVNEPTLNVQGIRSADTGKLARNVIPAIATANLGIRLVKGIPVKQSQDAVIEHIRKQGYFVTEDDPTPEVRKAHPKVAKVNRRGGGYPASKTPMDLPIARQVVAAIAKARGPVVEAPTLGGSVPLFMFEQELRTPFLGIPIANHDNNQHAANENIRLQNLWNGVGTMAAIMMMR